MSKLTNFMNEYKTEMVVFVILAVLFSIWLSNNSCGRMEYMKHGKKNKHIEYMKHGENEYMDETLMKEPVVKETVNGFNMGNNLAPIDFTPTRTEMKLGSECAGGNAAFVSSNLLPKMDMNEDITPGLQGMNLLQTEDVIGIDTVSNTNKNANYSLRSEPANPKTEVSPWLNSTIEPDPYRKESII